jgi:hypothetical protein
MDNRDTIMYIFMNQRGSHKPDSAYFHVKWEVYKGALVLVEYVMAEEGRMLTGEWGLSVGFQRNRKTLGDLLKRFKRNKILEPIVLMEMWVGGL